MAVAKQTDDPLSIYGKLSPLGQNRLLRRFISSITRAMRIGTTGYDRNTSRRLAIVNLAGYLSAVSSLTFAICFSLHDVSALMPLIIGNLLSALLTLTAPFWHRFNSIAAALVMTITVAVTLPYFVSELGRDSGVQLNLIGSVAIAFVIFGLGNLHIVAGVTVYCIAAHLACVFMFETGRVQHVLDEAFLAQLYVLSAITIILILALIVWYAFRIAADAEKRSERLLHNVLPTSVAERLLDKPSDPIADAYDEATVLFADIVGFTTLSRELAPEQTVRLLTDLFISFDELCELHSVEKIKTIGDAYMAVCGVPKPQTDHAERCLQLAIGMLRAAEEIASTCDRDLAIRIGIATGPMTAGVIGRKKFAYDVWSPTVNLAAGLEASGKPGEIHVSDSTWRKLRDNHAFVSRTDATMKGIGSIRTWLLEKKIS